MYVCKFIPYSPELKGNVGWSHCDFWQTFPVAKELVRDNCERISALDVDERVFIERCEKPSLPVVITDCQVDWQATKKWTIEVNCVCVCVCDIVCIKVLFSWSHDVSSD